MQTMYKTEPSNDAKQTDTRHDMEVQWHMLAARSTSADAAGQERHVGNLEGTETSTAANAAQRNTKLNEPCRV